MFVVQPATDNRSRQAEPGSRRGALPVARDTGLAAQQTGHAAHSGRRYLLTACQACRVTIQVVPDE